MFTERSAFIPESHPSYEPVLDRPLEELLDLAATIKAGEPMTFGATPLNRRRTATQQEGLLVDLTRFTYNIPHGIPLEIADYVHQTFRERFYGRMSANDENYEKALLAKDAYHDNPRLQEVIDRAEIGHASAAELLLLRSVLGMGSIELACLTHPYGLEERLELLAPMRETVKDSIETMGGIYIKDAEPRYRIKDVILKDVPYEDWSKVYSLSHHDRLAIADQYGGVAGFLMIRKRDIGKMPDGTTIRERSSFVLRTEDEAILTPDIKEKMLGLADSDTWTDEAVLMGGLDGVADTVMNTDQHTIAIPLSSTIYATNDRTRALIEQHKGDHVHIVKNEPDYRNMA